MGPLFNTKISRVYITGSENFLFIYLFVLHNLIIRATCANRASFDKGVPSFTDGLSHILPYSAFIFLHPTDIVCEELFKPGTETIIQTWN